MEDENPFNESLSLFIYFGINSMFCKDLVVLCEVLNVTAHLKWCPLQPDRVMEFCNNNDLQLIVRAHECVMDGFERFAQGHLITLFSATNYCGMFLASTESRFIYRQSAFF